MYFIAAVLVVLALSLLAQINRNNLSMIQKMDIVINMLLFVWGSIELYVKIH